MRNLSSIRTSNQRTATITLFMKKMPRCKQWHPTSGSTMENKNKINSKKRPIIPMTMRSMKILRMKRTKMILKRQTILMKKKMV